MSSKKILAVFGASGIQGGGIICELLKYPEIVDKYDIRAISRNVEAAKTKSIFPPEKVAWVQADISQPASVVAALDGVDVCYGLTNYWEHCDYDQDIVQGKTIVDACIEQKVDWFIWSSQYPAAYTSRGTLEWTPAADGKAQVGYYADKVKSTGGKDGKGMVVTHFIPTFYMQNLSKFMVWPNEDGVLTWKMPWKPDSRMPYVDAEIDLGAYIVAMLLSNPADFDGKKVHAGSEWSTPATVVREYEEVTGQKMLFSYVTPTEWAETLPPNEGMRKFLPPLMEIVGVHSEWGPGSEELQPEHDKVLEKLGPDFKKCTWKSFVQRGAFEKEYKSRMDAFSKFWAREGQS